MAGSSNNIDTGALYFGTVNPTVTGQEVDNDSFMVTSDGTPTGTPISFWKFDEETLTWVQVPSGNSCPAPMTRVALIALRNANGLSKDCDYVITDHVQGRLVSGTTIHLQAVSANELSENVQVNTTYDNEAWRGIYDIDRALVLELQDNRNNIARGFNGTEVSNFDWGNTNYTNVKVDQATLTVTYGYTALVNNVIIEQASTVTLTGFTGQFLNSHVKVASILNLTGANGIWRYMEITDNSTLNASGYTGGGDNYYNRLAGVSNVNFSNRTTNVTFRQNDLVQGIINASGATAITNIQTTHLHNSTIVHATTAGALNITQGNKIDGASSLVHEMGVLNLATSQISQSSTLRKNVTASTDNHTRLTLTSASNLTNSSAGSISTTSLRMSSGNFSKLAGALNVTNVNTSEITVGNLVIAATSNALVNITQTLITQGSVITLSSLSGTTISRTSLSGASNIILEANSNGNVNINDVQLSGGARISKFSASTSGILSVTGGTSLDSSGFINHSGTGNLTVSQGTIYGSGGINVTGGNRSYNFVRCTLYGVARANLSGTGAVQDNFNEVTICDRGAYTSSCSGTANNLNYSIIAGLSGAITLTGTTGGKNMNRIKCNDGSINMNNNPNAGLFQLWNVSDAGVITVSNNSANQNINYVNVTAGGQFIINRTGTGLIQYVDVINNGTLNLLGTSGAVTKAIAEQGTLTMNGGSCNNIVKRLQGTWIINGGFQQNTYHLNSALKTTTVANTNRVDYLGVVSTVPIL